MHQVVARDNHFDLVRLLAAFEVVLGHGVDYLQIDVHPVLDPIYTLIRWFPGVPIFFALSGYLLANSLAHNEDLRRYARNRALRVFPALWACFLVTAALLAAAGLLFELSPAMLVVFVLAQLSVAQTWVPPGLEGFGVGIPNPSLWTIRVEIGFYLALPILVLAGRAVLGTPRRVDALLVTTAVVSYGIYLPWGASGYDDSGYPFLLRVLINSPAPFLWLFVAGVLAHRHEAVVRRFLAGRWGWYWLGLFLLARGTIFVFFEAGQTAPELPRLPLGITNLIMVAPAFALAFSRVRFLGWLRPPADISYGVYLWHMVVVNVLVHWDLLRGAPAFVVMLVVTTVLGVVSWVLVEAPALTRKRPAPSPVPAASREVASVGVEMQLVAGAGPGGADQGARVGAGDVGGAHIGPAEAHVGGEGVAGGDV